jgi:hypothetical protein
MKRTALLLALATLPTFLWVSPSNAQAPHPAAVLTLAQVEQVAVDLRQGMSAEEVHKLLGQPRRTALKSDGGALSNAPSLGTLQWTYSWSASQGNLRIDFVAKAPDQWYVRNWEWANY